MVRFSEEQVLEATRGKRGSAGARRSYEAVCTDTRKLTPGCLFVALEGEMFDAHQFLADAFKGGAAGAVVRRGKAPAQVPDGVAVFEVDNTLHALGGLAHFHRLRFKIPLGAVTGSNGKTTTKDMVGSILATRGPALKTEGNLNNEVGVPLTLFNLAPSHVAAIVEMGMNHPGEISRLAAIAAPTAGLITVVQPAHLKGLGTLENVAAAKGELFFGLGPRATAVVNLDAPLIVDQARRSGATVLTFGRSDAADVQLVAVEEMGTDGMAVRLRIQGADRTARTAFVGAHNGHNACAAAALATALGYTPAECIQGLEAARPTSGRLNVLAGLDGVTVVDDAYNANPASMEAALATVAQLAKTGRAVAVLGDMLELGDEEAAAHRALADRAVASAALVALFGPRLGQASTRLTPSLALSHFTEVEPLWAWLQPKLQPGDVVLVKGSRGMRLERVVDALTGRTPGGAH
jgi:UDP-N-acetylmuramoyl-tripeptide--D-alanyl-D-alanine ligase